MSALALKSLPRLGAITTAMLGGLGLMGWTLGLPVLKSVVPGLAEMKPNTAIAFILAGVSLALLERTLQRPAERLLARASALLVALIGLLTLCQYVFGWNAGIDLVLFGQAHGAVATTIPGRMSPNTALGFLLSGSALLALHRPARIWPAQLLAGSAGLIALMALIGYCYGVPMQGSARYTGMALNTALAFLLLTAGILSAYPGRGLVKIVWTDCIGGHAARRLLPAAIILPFVLGWLHLEGERAGLFGSAFGSSVLVAAVIFFFATGVLWAAWSLNLKDRQAKLALASARAGEALQTQLLESLRVSDQYNRRLFETAAIGLALSRMDGSLVDVNPAYASILGNSVEETLRLNFWQLTPHNDLDEQRQQQLEQLRTDGRFGPFELEYIHRDGHRVPVRLSGVLLERNGEACIWSSIEDISEHRQAEARFIHLTHYDPLTGLANRALIRDRLGQAIIEAERRARTIALVRVDLDDFKGINDALGHDIGDLVLRDVAERLRHAVRPSDTVGRLGDDEFVLVLADMARAEDAELVVQKLLAVFDEDFMLDGRAVFLSASLGISIHPQDGGDAEELLRSSDIALLRAKRRGKGSYQFYDPVMSTHMMEQRAVEDDLRQALARNEFVLHYQPVIRAGDGSILGVEALLRWQHPTRGMIPPLDFIPLAEDSGLIVPIGAWVLREACRQAAQWQRDGNPSLCLAVNVSARQFTANHVTEKVAEALEGSGLDPRWLKLEITESSLMQQDNDVAGTLKVLRSLGVSLAIDDFGTDYSNFAYLRALKPETLKIDRSLVSDVAIDVDAAAITHAIIAMAHHLGINVVAEGVETAEQAAVLRGQGCDALQGYYFGRPMPADALTPLLAVGCPIPA